MSKKNCFTWCELSFELKFKEIRVILELYLHTYVVPKTYTPYVSIFKKIEVLIQSDSLKQSHITLQILLGLCSPGVDFEVSPSHGRSF